MLEGNDESRLVLVAGKDAVGNPGITVETVVANIPGTLDIGFAKFFNDLRIGEVDDLANGLHHVLALTGTFFAGRRIANNRTFRIVLAGTHHHHVDIREVGQQILKRLLVKLLSLGSRKTEHRCIGRRLYDRTNLGPVENIGVLWK